MNYFVTGFILAIVICVLTALLFKFAMSKGMLDRDNTDDQSIVMGTLCIIAILVLVGWPIFIPIWFLAIVIMAILYLLFPPDNG